jgi:AbrB family looped-hinge helix DNA binding protein
MTKFNRDRYLFGTVKVGERGQIVIPKEARELFEIMPGDLLMVFGNKRRGGIAIVKADKMREFALRILQGIGRINGSIENKKEVNK